MEHYNYPNLYPPFGSKVWVFSIIVTAGVSGFESGFTSVASNKPGNLLPTANEKATAVTINDRIYF